MIDNDTDRLLQAKEEEVRIMASWNSSKELIIKHNNNNNNVANYKMLNSSFSFTVGENAHDA